MIVCWSLSYRFLYLLYLFMIISYSTLLPVEEAHANAVDIGGITIKPIPVRLKVIELDVVAILTNVSIDFNIVVIVLYFFYFFFDLLFFSLKYVIISLMLLIWLIKLFTSFNFFPLVFLDVYFLIVVLMGIIYLFFGPFII